MKDDEAVADRTEADDARFLIHATFGPTKKSLKDLADETYEEWITKQMRPGRASFHRAHFRARANPPFDADLMPVFASIGQCEKGSRWTRHAFTQAHLGKQVSLTGKIKVEDNWVSDIDPAGTGNKVVPTVCTNDPLPEWSYTCEDKPTRVRHGCIAQTEEWTTAKPCRQSCFDAGFPYEGDDCSQGWAPYRRDNFNGYVCQVEEGVGGKVMLSSSRDCRSMFLLRNPAIWCKSCDPLEEIPESALESNPLLPGRFFLAAETPECPWDDSDLVTSGDGLLHFESRMALVDNLPEAPTVLFDGTCVNRNFFNEATCRVLPKDAVTEKGCFQVCGSPEEVANEPIHGHQRPIVTSMREQPDKTVDNSYWDRQPKDLGKSLTWTELVMAGDDQLRQRMAWSLSQIYVMASLSLDNEMFLAYYDIFVRNAFGNLRNLLQQVTYNPVMGEYLTYMGSRSFDHSGSFADENYAREIMQLFSIGLTMLHPNGSSVVDANGEEVPTYGNEQIMNFARVFTGFHKEDTMRANLEQAMRNNMIDPMVMNGAKHDVYPKPDLYGGFLGDGFPLCRDLPERSFLTRGARYEFLGYSYEGYAFELAQDSNLFGALCVESSGTCSFATVVTLRKRLQCTGAECTAGPVGVVKVGDGFYQYVTPPCVYSFFYNGKLVATPERWGKSFCVDPALPLAAGVCCAGGDSGTGAPCSNTPNSGMIRNGHTCETAEQTWLLRDGRPQMSSKYCNKNRWWPGRKTCQLECFKLGLGYEGDDCDHYGEKLTCSTPTEFVSFDAAEQVCEKEGLNICGVSKDACDASLYVWQGGDCPSSLQVHEDGKISAYTEHAENRFAVPWVGEVPPAGTYEVTVEEKAAFTGSELPSKAQVMTLKIGAFARGGTPAAEQGEVKAWGPTAPMDESTVFECDGRLYKNTLSVVHVQANGGTFSFRNPPAFIRPGPLELTGGDLNRAALAEVESLLDHLFYHPNTATFIGRKLAQRFVTSNPSGEYLTAITEAFRSGTYGGKTYGEYGSLGATLAAILLHPEARSSSHQNKNTGLLREPMLKLIHFMRSMEYSDDRGEFIAFRRLVDTIGQFPYESPTVFNFFDAEFMPSRFSASEPEPEPEPEPAIVAPEFEIFTPPLAIGLLNGLSTILKFGVTNCETGLGIGDLLSSTCNRGSLGFSPSSEQEALGELDLLLTGGRLTELDAAVVKRAYDTPPEGGSQLEAAQKAILFMPEFHNLGDPAASGTRPAPVPTPVHEAKNYKAVVMLFFAGGADTFHMLVPTGCALYDEYKQTRGDAAHRENQLHPIKSNNPRNCDNFGLHPEMSYIADLYNNPSQKHGSNAPAAFLSNIGALVEPLTRSNLKRSTKQKCLGLFSHSHQQKAAQTLHCQVPGAAPKGVGGRMADVLAEQYKVESFSITGTATWSEGFDTQTEIISGPDGVVRLSNYDVWGDAITNITRQRHGNVYCEEYVRAFADAIESSEKLGTYVDDVELETTYQTETGLQKQFHQVARLIKSRHGRKAERDFFFVQIGGWDHHTNLHEGFAEKMKEVNGAIEGFVEEMKLQQDFDKTVLVTASDFGRTLTYNGMGTDHGWGGNHFVIGGSIRGGQIFNDYITSFDLLTSEYITDRGRVVPLYPWENIMVPIAEWLGVKEQDITTAVFPNLGNFNRTKLIIPCKSLFVDGAC